MKTSNLIKKSFQEKSYYAIGTIGGIFIGILPMFLILIDKFILLSDLLLYIPRKIAFILCGGFFCGAGLILTPILSIFLYTLLGLLIAFLFRKIKSSKKTEKNK